MKVSPKRNLSICQWSTESKRQCSKTPAKTNVGGVTVADTASISQTSPELGATTASQTSRQESQHAQVSEAVTPPVNCPVLPSGVSYDTGGRLLLELDTPQTDRADIVPRAGSLLAMAANEVAKIDNELKEKSEAKKPDLPTYNFKSPKKTVLGSSAFDGVDFVKKLNGRVQKCADELGHEKALHYRRAMEHEALEEATTTLLESSIRNGLGAKAVEDDLVRLAVTAEIIKKLKAGGVRLDPELVRSRRMFSVVKTDPWDGESTTKLVSRGPRSNIMLAQRVMELEPSVISDGNHQIGVYNAAPEEFETVVSAVRDMDSAAPKLVENLRHVHMTHSLGGTVTREQEGELARPGEITGRTSVEGLAPGASPYFDTSSSMMIKKAPLGTSQGKLRKQYADEVPEGSLRETRMKETIYHEAAHLLDWAASEDGKPLSEAAGSPFLQVDESKREDFVSDYAMTNATEDFAETAAFVVQLAARKEPNILKGQPLTKSLLKKLVAATKVTGADPTLITKLDGWSDLANKYASRVESSN